MKQFPNTTFGATARRLSVATLADGSTVTARPLTRFENIPEANLDGANYCGLWNADLNPAATYETGWGVSIDQFFSTIVAVGYIYDDTGAPTWVITSGGKWINATAYEGPLYRATGTSLGRRWVVAGWKTFTAGSAHFVFHGQGDATIAYTIDGKSVTKTLKRFVNS
jgi:hypothetical protein